MDWQMFCTATRHYGIILLDEDGRVVAWNEGARLLNGYSEDEILGEHFSRLYTPEASAIGHPDRELAHAAAVGQYEEEGWQVRKDGTRFWAHVVITAIHDENHVLRGFGEIICDITGRKQADEQSANVINLLEYTARTDYLTGLGNRRSLDELLSVAIAKARRRRRSFSLAMIDFDNFKRYNDEFGHQSGDAYLKLATARWRKALRPGDVITRYGGEEFVLLLPDTRLAAAACPLERLRAVTPAPLTCSIGAAEWDGSERADCLIGRADQALYRAKSEGRDRLVLAPAASVKGATPIATAAGPVRRESPASGAYEVATAGEAQQLQASSR
jgi:diguanylate cyclase (GGDEF)-like protein/PAS domain S-box-containing protein